MLASRLCQNKANKSLRACLFGEKVGRENYKREKLRREAHFPVWHRGEVATREIEVTNFHLFAIFPFMRRNRGEIVYLIAIMSMPLLPPS